MGVFARLPEHPRGGSSLAGAGSARWEGGAGETPHEGAARELAEETGLVLDIAAAPVFAAVRSYRDDLPPTLNLSYWSVASPAKDRLVPEADQPALWVDVGSAWRTYHADDAQVISGFAERKRCERRDL
ncbi:NUDIX domain-containing protein [Pseudarthrobacter sp. L19]|uniref:NUDIX domain-containing protein n=1 Tax=Pseudarthrobacter sp. L19 TaxID=3423951 RepID=UPI003D7B94C8